ncbi:hypothetical protein HX864_01245 [Pseudomonas yamanorum]|uniref:hypothetical protein n=1 Tax=Pseudomonas yamanorum TaxID=515393 RepID=UPI0015A0C85F|nr:hypothetical protein [Pseudomonas yamanorum]NWD21873.1 hypothetical protein [Pseudomonas yamanorum]
MAQALPPSANTNILLTQLTTGPSIREVAANTLRPALKELYPEQDIDPDQAIVVSPFWLIAHNTELVPGEPRVESLSGALARHALSGTPVVYLDGEHYLTYRRNYGPDVHLPVRVDAIARLINEFAPLLFTAYQEQQLDYWNATGGPRGARWQALASSLQDVWDIKAPVSWDEDELAMAKNVFLFPDYAVRLPHDKYRTRAYLMDVDVTTGTRTEHVNLASLAVLIGSHEEHTMILTYSIATGYEQFDSLEALGQSLTQYAVNLKNQSLQWRLFEPEGNFFEHQACVLISLQIDALGELGEPLLTANGSTEHERPEFSELSEADQAKLERIGDALPDWLKDAAPADLSSYSRRMLDLAALNNRNSNKTYLDDIPSIGDYALQSLAKAMAKKLTVEQKQALGLGGSTQLEQQLALKLAQVRITVTSQVVWGLFTAPGLTSTATFTLTELALENLIALPLGNRRAHHQNGRVLPDWMDAAYLQDLITEVNIGEQYPKLIKDTLLQDTPQSQLRQTLYVDQLRLQLPLLALQYKMRNQYGVDEQGYRYLCAAMEIDPNQRRVGGQPIVIRPLAFIPTRRLSQTADLVSNMFVIGPLDANSGPCLLYRPLFDKPLLQFASPNNLIYAVKQTTPVRQSVLAWLPDGVRFEYAQFVFPGSLTSPWVLSKMLIEPLTALTMSGQVILGSDVLHDNDLASLFKANANALVTLADQQSVSNAEARWESFKHTGWLIFNAALPFLGKTVGAAAWIGQLIDDVQQVVDASETGDSEAKWSALTDIFLNLGMALALHLATRNAPVGRSEKITFSSVEDLVPVQKKPLIEQLPNIDTTQPPAGHESSLHTLGALTRKPASLKKTLDSFGVAKPENLGAQQTEPGAHQHLYPLNDHWYAPVGERWFQVVVDENDSVMIVDPKQPNRLGPLLINNRVGHWFIDTRLRLRGGGFKNRLKKGQRRKPATINELRVQLDAFDDQKKQKYAALEAAQAASRAAPPETTQAQLTTYIEALEKRRTEYDLPIAQLKSLNILDTVPDYTRRMLRYVEQQMLMAQAAISEQLGPFEAALDAVEHHLSGDARALLDHRRLADRTQSMISLVEYIRSRFKELKGLGAEGAQLELQTRGRLPPFELDDMRAFRISLSRYLCVQENGSASMADARHSINEIMDSADTAIQSTRSLLLALPESDLAQQIEALDDLVDQFAVINQDLLDLPNEHPEGVLKEAVEDTRQRVDTFAQRAAKQLSTALREKRVLEARPGPSTAPPQPRRKIIKTRFKGIVVGEPRENEPDLFDVKAPLTGKVIATYHEKTPGVWVKRQTAAPHVSRPPTVSVANSLKRGRALLDDVDGFIQRTQVLAGDTQRLPVEIMEKFQRQVLKLEHASQVVESAANASNETDNTDSLAVSQRLDEAVKRLYREARRINIEMLKARPPTAAHLELLSSEGEISIQPVDKRQKLGPKKGYMQEYEILDQKTKRPLWYAHFHYETLKARDEGYTTAHLKTPAQRRLGGGFEEREATSEQASREIYRSKIGPQLARSLFLNPVPVSAPGTSGTASAKPGPGASTQG